MRPVAVVLALGLLVGACASSDDDDDGSASSATSTDVADTDTVVTVRHGNETEPSAAAGSPAAEQAVADLAAQHGIDPAEITVVSDELVTWPDSSLGCPQAGMGYLQVLTDGIRVVVEHAGQQYEYHGAVGRPPFLCTNPQPAVEE